MYVFTHASHVPGVFSGSSRVKENQICFNLIDNLLKVMYSVI